MGKRKRSSTQWMLDAVTRERSESMDLPPELICGLRGALEAGLSCEEITSLLVLFAGIYEAAERWTGPELIERATLLGNMMKGEICCLSEQNRGRLIRRAKK